MSSSDDTTKIKRKLSTLTSSLHNLETNLAELLSQSLPELVLGLDTIQQAKLQVVIPYLLYDLVFGPSQNFHISLHAVPPTGMTYSLPKDKRSRPENAPSNCRARAHNLLLFWKCHKCQGHPIGQSAPIFR